MNALKTWVAWLSIAALFSTSAHLLPAASGVGLLHIEAIDGEAQRDGYTDWIDIQSLAFSAEREVDSIRSTSSEPELSALTITKSIDLASPRLFAESVEGGMLPEVVIDFFKAGDLVGEPRFVQVILSNAIVTRYETRAMQYGSREIVSFAFERIEIEVKRNDGGTIRAYYDLTTRTGGELPGDPPPDNTPPTISVLTDRAVEVNGTLQFDFEIADGNTASEFLHVTAQSSNPALLPVKNILFTGSGDIRTATLTPAPATAGVSEVTFFVSDGLASTSSQFTVTVTSDTTVLISRIDDVITGAGETVAIPFTVGHLSIDPSLLSVTAVADDESLVSIDGFVFSGSGAERTATITPTPGETGATQITFTVSDGTGSVSEVFLLTVEATSPPPAITAPSVVKGMAEPGIYLTGISLADPSAIDNPIMLQLDTSYGILSIDTTIADGVTADMIVGNLSASVTITAPLDAINATLAAATGVHFQANGETGVFQLALEASRSGSSTLAVAVELYDSGLALWRSEHFSAADLSDPERETDVWGNFATPAGDGIPNLIKYALGLPPMQPHVIATSTALTIAHDDAQQYLTFTVRLRSDDPALSFSPELSSDLEGWTSGPDMFEKTSEVPLDEAFKQVVYRRPVAAEDSHVFVRIRIGYDTM